MQPNLSRLVLYFLCFTIIADGQTFVEVSQAIGIDHSHRHRGLMGGGAAFFDYDNDGDEDLYLTRGQIRDDFYINNGDGTFTLSLDDVGFHTASQTNNTTAVITGDIDNDGDRDVFLTTWERYEGASTPDGRCLLFLNNGDQTFTEIGAEAGIIHEAFSIGATFLDYNQDGYLDIYVINHILEPMFTYDSTGLINGFAHDCYPSFLYRNNGDLTFTEVAQDAGVADEGCALAVMSTDYDLDGDLDIYIANDFGEYIVPNTLYQNQYPNDGFLEVGESTNAGVAIFGMGIAGGDYDHDQDLDYYITNLGRNVLLENQNAIFTDVTTGAGVENTDVPTGEFTTGWGTAFFDVDNDTWEDLFVANGRIPSLSTLPTAFADPNKLYRNNGDKTFTDVTDDLIGDPSYSRGMAFSDFDQDGDLDFVVVNLDELGATTKFYRNETDNNHHYVQIKLTGKESNRDAFGSKIWLYTEDQVFLREIYGGGESHASQHSSVAHFGLGTYEAVDSIRIEWTNGHIDYHYDLAINTRHYFEENVTTNTNELALANRIQIFPNPFEDEIGIYFKEKINEPIKLGLISATGKLIYQEIYSPEQGLKTLSFAASLPTGLYLLSIQTNEGILTKKVLKK